MSDDLRIKLVSELSSKFPSELIEELISSYEKVLIEFRKGAWDETLWKAGKFTENVFRLLYHIVHSKVIREAPNMNALKKELENLQSEKAPDSIRVLIPRIATAMIYDPRSKKGAVHVKPVNPDYLDATLVVSACDWVLAELLREFHTKETEEIRQIIQSVIARKVPFVERHGEESLVTIPLGNAEDEILLLLLDNRNGLDRTTIGKWLKNFYTQGRVTQALQKLARQRLIFLNSESNYVITGPGEAHISALISKVSV